MATEIGQLESGNWAGRHCESCGRWGTHTPQARFCQECIDQRVLASRAKRARAAYAVHSAVRAGTLIRPELCENCGQPARSRIHGHHRSYTPEHLLDVEWLCPKCHYTWHAAERKQR